jgi:DHA1 family tetracycline resistance protein-like MFS transporter
VSEPEAPSDRPPVAAFATVFITLFLDLVAFGIVIPVLPYYAEHFGASPSVVTLLSTSFSLSQLAMAPVLGRWSDRFGRRPVLLVSIAGAAASQLTVGLAHSLWLVFLGRLVSGASSASVATAQAYVADRVAPIHRAKYMGMMGSAIGLGFIFGPALGGVLSTPEHPELPFLVAAGLSAANFLLALWLLPESRRAAVTVSERSSRWAHIKTIFRGSQLAALVVVSFLYFTAFSAMESTFALLMERRLEWTARETGLLFTGIGVVIFLTQGIAVGRVVAWIGERITLVAGILVLVVGLCTTGTSTTVLGMVLGAAGIACGNGLVSPSITAIVSRSSSADEQGLNIGVNQSAAALARIVGPTSAGFLFEHVGHGVPMLGGAGVLVIAAIVVLASVRQPS